MATPAILVHGHGDTLVPFTETLRRAATLPLAVVRRVTITRLVGHTKARKAEPLRSPITVAREVGRFVRAMHQIVTSLED